MHYLDPIHIIQTVGLIGIFVIVFLESGVFFGFFFPGDSLLFTAGIFAKAGFFPIESLIGGSAIAAILGGIVGYFSGRKVGIKFFNDEANIFFKKKYIYDAEHFYKKHGSGMIILARFVPIIRTFAPIVAGLGKMRYRTFFLYNFLSGIMWATLISGLGYFVGGLIPNVDKFILPIACGIILVSVLPFILKMINHRKK